MPRTTNTTSVQRLNDANRGKLPGHLGLEITLVEPGQVVGRFPIRQDLVAHTGYLLAGALLTVADILCAYGVSTVWPDGATGFTTAEVKCNFISTLTEGAVVVSATLLHGGRTTQIWDAAIADEATGRMMAVFRCTQIILYPALEPAMSHEPRPVDHLVHDAVGPALSGLKAGAAIAIGINSLLFAGVIPVILGTLADEHRLTAPGIGLTAMVEALATGLSTAAMGLIRRPRHLRLIAVTAAVALAGLNLAATGVADGAMMAVRAATGAVEGVFLWITIAMIARTVTPERWAGVFVTILTLAQLGLAIALAQVVLPRFGANGAFTCLAACAGMGVIPALLGPDRFATLPVAPDESEVPPTRGWIALAATLVYVSAAGAVGVYLQPLAHEAGLDASVARTAVWVSLAMQVVGGALATALAGRVRYFAVFVLVTTTYLAVWWLMGRSIPAWLFIGANAVAGLGSLLLIPFLVPMTIDADPSRRAAMQSGAAQLLGGALGPLLASQVVGGEEVRGVLWLGAGLLLAGLVG